MIQDGKYSFRFNGFAMSRGIPHHVVGIGVMTLEKGGITGEHVSSIARMTGQDAAFDNTRYTLKGIYRDEGNFGAAEITFLEDPNEIDPQEVRGAFNFVPAGPDRFWLVSTSTRIISAGNAPADEVVSGEAVRLGPA